MQISKVELIRPYGVIFLSKNNTPGRIFVITNRPSFCHYNFMELHLTYVKLLSILYHFFWVVSEISEILVHLRSPFPNLKYLKLPYGCKGSDMPSFVRQYLLGGSPHATIAETLSRVFIDILLRTLCIIVCHVCFRKLHFMYVACNYLYLVVATRAVRDVPG